MAFYHAHPPHRLHSSRLLEPAEALSLISCYLEASITDASLHPNALLTESGPVSATQGLNTSLILHNLKRVEAGLQGEHLGADLSFTQFGGEGLPDLQVSLQNDGVGPETTRAVDVDKQGPDPEMGVEGWQDKVDFEREQEVVEGEIGEGSEAVIVGSREDVDVPRVAATGDKEARKQNKKLKRQKERRAAEEKKKREKDMDMED